MQQINEVSKNAKSKNLVHLSDDSIIMDFDFKPITDGLGFKNSNQPSHPVSRPVSSTTTKLPSLGTKTQIQQPLKTDLDLFYHQLELQKNQTPINVEPKIFLQASFTQRSLAMGLDLVFLASIEMLTLVLIDFFSGVPLIDLLKNFNLDVWGTALVLFAFYYIGYFSIAEKFLSTSIGKEMVGIKLDKESGHKSLQSFFLRSFISFFSFFTFGLVGYYDLQGRATDTKIVRI